MQPAEIGAGKALLPHHCHRQRIAERKHHRRRSGRCDCLRTDFGPVGQHQERGSRFGKRRSRVPGDGDNRDFNRLEMIDDRLQFRRHSGKREQDRDIALRGDSKVAVDRFGEMEKSGGRSGRSEGGGDLASDVAGFAEALKISSIAL